MPGVADKRENGGPKLRRVLTLWVVSQSLEMHLTQKACDQYVG